MNQQVERRVQKVENWSSLMLFGFVGWLVGWLYWKIKARDIWCYHFHFKVEWGPLSVLEVSLEPRIYPKTIVRLTTVFGYLTISWFLLPFVILHFPRRIQPNKRVTTVFGYLIISWFLLPFVILHLHKDNLAQ